MVWASVSDAPRTPPLRGVPATGGGPEEVPGHAGVTMSPSLGILLEELEEMSGGRRKRAQTAGRMARWWSGSTAGV